MFSNLTHWPCSQAPESDTPPVLLIHGLGGSPEWMSPLGQQLNLPNVYGVPMSGYDCQQPAGHFCTVPELIAPALNAVKQLTVQTGSPPVVIGLSLGGVVATLLAGQVSMRGLCVISPGYRGDARSYGPSVYAKVAFGFAREALFRRPAKAIRTPFKTEHITRNPIFQEKLNSATTPFRGLSATAYGTLLRAQCWDLPRSLQQITMPFVMCVAGQDAVCDIRAMKAVFDRVPTPQKEWLFFKDSCHDLVLEPEMPQMAASLRSWILTL